MFVQVFEDTWEEIKRNEAEFIGRQLRVTVKAEKSGGKAARRTRSGSALSKYAFVPGGSEAFVQGKRDNQ